MIGGFLFERDLDARLFDGDMVDQEAQGVVDQERICAEYPAAQVGEGGQGGGAGAPGGALTGLLFGAAGGVSRGVQFSVEVRFADAVPLEVDDLLQVGGFEALLLFEQV